ncbi:MAG: DNA-binding transcriptional LysR family regulator [Oleispira sp.]|jgi:DNA-binding transcriptional LysR family regulator
MLLEDLQVVLKVAEFRNITAAATHLDMRTATASAALKRVEAALGAELFIRTTRQLRISSAGEKYIPQCEQALQMLEHAKQNIQGEAGTVEGELRIALSSDLGRNVIMPWLDEFMDAHPKVRLRINASDSNIDFYRDSVDMALRYGKPDDANLYGFKICNVPGLLCATQEYLDKHGIPKHPEELKVHNGLFYQLHDIIHNIWIFSKNNNTNSNNDSEEYKIKMNGNRASNDGDLVRRWCVSGKGLAIKSCLDMSADLLANKVTSVMPDYQPRSTELWLIFPSRQSITPAARLLRDMLKQKCNDVLKQLVEENVLDKSTLN